MTIVLPFQGPYGLGMASVAEIHDAQNEIPLETQLRAMRKDLKAKDEKIARLTEHSVMMANYMDKLKGEVT